MQAASYWIIAASAALLVLALAGAMREERSAQWRGTRLEQAWQEDQLLRAGDATASHQDAKLYASHTYPYPHAGSR